ncbi:MAG: AtpZ/AtpI family protein [Acidobacteriales bacterium]|nr:AtpZ/AtpI family protein [Terriglobales bacterium]
MPEERPVPEQGPSASARRFADRVAAGEARLIRRKKEGPRNFWRAMSLAGVIGWTVVLPMLAGIAVGGWIDRRWPSRLSWTIMLLFAGLVAGCANAWNRIKREQEDR